MGNSYCIAKRQVDRSMTDNSIVAVLYEGVHEHERPTDNRKLQLIDDDNTAVTMLFEQEEGQHKFQMP